jgi:hypothetical protein
MALGAQQEAERQVERRLVGCPRGEAQPTSWSRIDGWRGAAEREIEAQTVWEVLHMVAELKPETFLERSRARCGS